MNKTQRGLATVVAVLILAALATAALGSRMLGAGMIWSAPGAGAPADGAGTGAWMVLGWLTMLVFWGTVIAGVVLLFRVLTRTGSRSSGTSAMDLLRRRYEAGEITREQYEYARQTLRRDQVRNGRGA